MHYCRRNVELKRCSHLHVKSLGMCIQRSQHLKAVALNMSLEINEIAIIPLIQIIDKQMYVPNLTLHMR